MSTPPVFRLWVTGKELLPKWSKLPVSKDCWFGAEYVSDCHMISNKQSISDFYVERYHN